MTILQNDAANRLRRNLPHNVTSTIAAVLFGLQCLSACCHMNYCLHQSLPPTRTDETDNTFINVVGWSVTGKVYTDEISIYYNSALAHKPNKPQIFKMSIWQFRTDQRENFAYSRTGLGPIVAYQISVHQSTRCARNLLNILKLMKYKVSSTVNVTRCSDA